MSAIVAKPRTRTKTLALNALSATGEDALADRIKNCNASARCGNPYCMSCWKLMYGRFERRLRSRVHERFKGNLEAAHQDLRFVTILCALVEPDPKAVREAVHADRDRFTRVRRSFPDVWLQGAYDFECVDTHTVLANSRHCPKNADVIATLSDGEVFDETHRILVHIHLVVDLNGVDESRFIRRLKRVYNLHPLQVHVCKLDRVDRSIKMHIGSDLFSANMRRLSKYTFKRETRYKIHVTDGDRAAKGPRLTERMLSFMVSVYSNLGSIGYKGLLVYSN